MTTMADKPEPPDEPTWLIPPADVDEAQLQWRPQDGTSLREALESMLTKIHQEDLRKYSDPALTTPPVNERDGYKLANHIFSLYQSHAPHERRVFLAFLNNLDRQTQRDDSREYTQDMRDIEDTIERLFELIDDSGAAPM
jgi:hypothetical protein